MSPHPPPPARKRVRVGLIDLVLLALVAFAVAYAAYRINDVLVYRWSWDRVLAFVIRYDEATGRFVPNLLLQGVATTLRLAFWGTVFASIIGVIMGLARTSRNLAFRLVSRAYVELIRNIPPIVFIFIFYFFISTQLFPVLGVDSIPVRSAWVDNPLFSLLAGDPRLFSNFLAGVVCLALFEGAYITEIVRAGVQSIENGQWEAARAIGLSRFNVLRDIVLPQAIRRILPPLAGQFITLIKDSAMVSLISIQELTFLATEVAATTTRVFETWIVVGALYFIICYSFAVVFAHLEARARRANR